MSDVVSVCYCSSPPPSPTSESKQELLSLQPKEKKCRRSSKLYLNATVVEGSHKHLLFRTKLFNRFHCPSFPRSVENEVYSVGFKEIKIALVVCVVLEGRLTPAINLS